MTQLSRRTILKAGMAGFAASAFPGLAFAKAKKEDKRPRSLLPLMTLSCSAPVLPV